MEKPMNKVKKTLTWGSEYARHHFYILNSSKNIRDRTASNFKVLVKLINP